jgi:murein DD-endopeptidase MepM/ murein hydrolase activator NlpD
MRRIVTFVVTIGVVLLLFGVILVSAVILPEASALACSPTAASVIAGQIIIGSGPAVTQYFAQFSAQIVAQKKANAALIIQIGRSEGFSDYSIAIAIGTALQESGLLNLPGGNADSLGLFQQRPSIGSWGTASQIMDPTHAIEAFFKVLKTIPNRDQMPMIDAAMLVQIPNKADYERTWHWDTIATELSGKSGGEVCSGNGTIHLPLDPGYSVTARYDDTDANYPGIKPHTGVDLSDYKGGSLGRPVYAVMAGVVVASGIGNSCATNNAVFIKQADGVETVYMHMKGSDITVHVGDTVTAGQQIGKIGDCGQATGPHLHFAVDLAQATAPWMNNLLHIHQSGITWIDPVGYMAYYGVTLVPNK